MEFVFVCAFADGVELKDHWPGQWNLHRVSFSHVPDGSFHCNDDDDPCNDDDGVRGVDFHVVINR